MADKPTALAARSLTPRRGSGYPPPFDAHCGGREKLGLGNAFGLTAFGVNLVDLPPGTASSQRHWHSREDELIYILSGTPILVTDSGRVTLGPGDCAGFRAGDPSGHHLVNETDAMVTYLEVGNRHPDDAVEYSDIDMRKPAGDGGFTRKDGTPYP